MGGSSQLWCEYAWLGGEAATAGVVIDVEGERIVSVRIGVAEAPRGAVVLPGYTLPGLANAHSHAFQRAFRGKTEVGRGTFWTWRERMYEAASRLDPDNYFALARATFGEMADAFLKAYPVNSDADAPAMFNAVMRDFERASMFFWAADRQKYSKTPAYTYYWTHSMPGPNEDRWGAFHCSEIPYFLNTLNRSPRPFTAKDRDIEAKMSAYYLNFVTTGNPSGKTVATWAPVDPAKPSTMELGDHWQQIPIAEAARFELMKQFFASRKDWR